LPKRVQSGFDFNNHDAVKSTHTARLIVKGTQANQIIAVISSLDDEEFHKILQENWKKPV